MDERFERFMRDRLRELGREFERTRRAYTEGKADGGGPPVATEFPVDESGRVKLVCRRYAEKRAVELNEEATPACFDPDHVDCVGCLEDTRDGVVETWE